MRGHAARAWRLMLLNVIRGSGDNLCLQREVNARGNPAPRDGGPPARTPAVRISDIALVRSCCLHGRSARGKPGTAADPCCKVPAGGRAGCRRYPFACADTRAHSVPYSGAHGRSDAGAGSAAAGTTASSGAGVRSTATASSSASTSTSTASRGGCLQSALRVAGLSD
jgi:hypothetical protein